jgi:hypothetical protein
MLELDQILWREKLTYTWKHGVREMNPKSSAAENKIFPVSPHPVKNILKLFQYCIWGARVWWDLLFFFSSEMMNDSGSNQESKDDAKASALSTTGSIQERNRASHYIFLV